MAGSQVTPARMWRWRWRWRWDTDPDAGADRGIEDSQPSVSTFSPSGLLAAVFTEPIATAL